MSIKAMNWAWEQKLDPSTKIVLLALADIADDRGICWPSIPSIARKVCTSERTVQRVMHCLSQGTETQPALIQIAARTRSNGSRSSNVYLLQVPGDKLSPGDIGDIGDGGMVTALRQEGGDKAATRGGDKATSPLEPPTEPPPEPTNRTTSRRAVDKQLRADAQQLIARELLKLGTDKQAALMVQLATGMREGSIRSPAAWVKAAVERMTKHQRD